MNDNERDLIYAKELARLIQVETISQNGIIGGEKFRVFHKVLKDIFPHVFSIASVENFHDSLLIKISSPKALLKPIMLMSHHDVVEPNGEWSHEPFSGDIAQGKIWGRGTLDTKGNLYVMLKACDELISEGYRFNRDIYIESACTEECEGQGAEEISQILEDRGIKFEYTLDEGGMIVYDPIGGADGTYAMIGVGEKGTVDIKFSAKSQGGHASMPPKHTPLVRLGEFMHEVDNSHIFWTYMDPVIIKLFNELSKTMKGYQAFIFKHAKGLKRLLCKVLPSISPAAGALLKTTIAFTMASGSEGRNVLPSEAYVIGNLRYSHHQGRDDSLAVLKTIADKYDIDMEILDLGCPSKISSYESQGYKDVVYALSQTYPTVIPTPYIMTGASDSRYFDKVAEACIRFAPFQISDKQLASIHGIDECLDIETLHKAVDFFRIIIKGDKHE